MSAGAHPVVDLLAGHRRIVITTLAVVLVGVIILVVVQITQAIAAQHRRALRTLDDALLRIQPFITGVNHQVQGMRLHLESSLVEGDAGGQQRLAKLRASGPGRFSLDQDGTKENAGAIGNCTGLGDPTTLMPSQQRQLAAAIGLDPLFRIGRKNLTEIAWSYVTTSWFIHIHPWRPSADYAFWSDAALLNQEFFVRAGPQSNPERAVFWTAPYRDGAGLGLMVTCSAPLYEQKAFFGSVSVDVTLDGLNRVLQHVEREPHTILVLSTAGGQVVYGPTVSSADSDVKMLSSVLPEGLHCNGADLAAMPLLRPWRTEGHVLMANEVPGTGWRLLLVQPATAMWFGILGEVLPWIGLSLGLMLTALIVAALLVRREFVLPSQRLVHHLMALGRGEAVQTAAHEVPEQWRPWFNEVDKVFDAKRELLAELQTAKDGLVRQVSERTAELSRKNGELERAVSHLQGMQDRMIEREKLASLGHLVAGLAHELNTPMAVALGAASHLGSLVGRLVGGVQGGELRRSDLEQIITDSRRAAHLVETNLAQAAGLVRSFKRVSADQATGERREIDLPSYLGEVVISLSSLHQRQHQVRLLPSPALLFDTCPGALTQVITNLVENAVIHGFPGGRPGIITLAVRELDSRVRLTCHDDGVGMPPEVLAHIFDPFFTTNRSQGGTGLGLSIVYALVTGTLGGEISCDSAPGHGTTFTIDLPRSPSRF